MLYNRYTLHVEYIGPLSGYYCWIKLGGLTVTKTIARKAEWALEDAICILTGSSPDYSGGDIKRLNVNSDDSLIVEEPQNVE